jgi:WD40 repeat protein
MEPTAHGSWYGRPIRGAWSGFRAGSLPERLFELSMSADTAIEDRHFRTRDGAAHMDLSGYDAFISYSRNDAGRLASELQVAMERFAKPWNKRRAIRIFRDDASMTANTNLWSTITAALQATRWFILLASERAAVSPGVAKEVEWWVAHKGTENFLLVQAGGNISWNAAAQDFDWEATTALPRSLEGRFPEEPRWIDMTWYLGVGEPKADPRFNERVADLAAAIRGLDRDDVVGENTRQYRRSMRYARGAIIGLAGLLAASLVAGGFAAVQANEARNQAMSATARQLAALATTSATTDLQTGLLQAVEAYRMKPDAQTRATLLAVSVASPQLVRFIHAGTPVTATAGTPGASTVVFGTEDGEVRRWDRSSGGTTVLGRMSGRIVDVSVSDDAGRVLAITDADAVVWNDGNKRTLTLPTGMRLASARVSPSGKTAAVGGEKRIAVMAATDAQPRVFDSAAHVFANVRQGWTQTVTLADDETVMGLSPGYGTWYRLRVADLAVVEESPEGFLVNRDGAEISPDGKFIAERTAVTGAISVWSTSDRSATLGGSALTAPSGVARPDSVAVSPNGIYVASGTDGTIFLGRVGPAGQATVPMKSLSGSGRAIPGTLHFLDERHLVSATGGGVSLWDLEQFSRIGKRWEAPVPISCTACGPAQILVSPGGKNAAIIGYSGTEMTVVDPATGRYWHGESNLFEPSFSGAAWINDDQLFVYSPAEKEAYFLEGWPQPRVAAQFSVDLGSGDNGRVLAVALVSGNVRMITTGGTFFEVNLDKRVISRQSQLVRQSEPSAWPVREASIDPAGTYAYLSPNTMDDSGKTVFSLDDARPVLTVAADYGFFDSNGGLVSLLGTTLTRTNLRSGTASTLESIPFDAFPSVSPDGSKLVYGATRGRVTILDAYSGRKIGVFDIAPSWSNATSFAFSPDGRSLLVAQTSASGSGGTLYTINLDPAWWIGVACTAADRSLTAQEWRDLTDQDAPGTLACNR